MAATGAPNKYLERFWDFVERGADSECWRWLGVTKPDGYGIFTARDPHKRTVYVHRHAYELVVGEIPDGLTVDHLCRVPPCVNPAHLEVVTRSENNRRRRGFNTWTHCPQGHAFTPDNTRIDGRGFQRCRACHRENQRRYRTRQAAA